MYLYRADYTRNASSHTECRSTERSAYLRAFPSIKQPRAWFWYILRAGYYLTREYDLRSHIHSGIYGDAIARSRDNLPAHSCPLEYIDEKDDHTAGQAYYSSRFSFLSHIPLYTFERWTDYGLLIHCFHLFTLFRWVKLSKNRHFHHQVFQFSIKWFREKSFLQRSMYRRGECGPQTAALDIKWPIARAGGAP